MSGTDDRLQDALDRLAARADSAPPTDPVPGIVRRARARRRRANALAAGAAGATVLVSAGVLMTSGLPGPERPPGPADGSSATPPEATRSTSPPLGVYDTARADVDGDGAADRVDVLLPAADADLGPDVSFVSEDVRLRVTRAAGGVARLQLGESLAPTITGTPDLDGDGSAEVVLTASGGDAAWLRTFVWDGRLLHQATPAEGSPPRLVDDGGLHVTAEAVGADLVEGRLLSWVPTEDTSAPYELRAWAWRLEQGRLVATRLDRPLCLEPGSPPAEC